MYESWSFLRCATGALAEQDILVAGRGKENLPDPFRSESGKRMNCQHRVRRFYVPGRGGSAR